MDNSEQAEFWNGRVGEAWVSVEDYIDRIMTPLTEPAISAAAAGAGDRVLDVGCGAGGTSFLLAGKGASVWGVDISDTMIGHASGKPLNGADVRFSTSDAATQVYQPEHAVVFSRFGVMFFADPVQAFGNLRTALSPGGRLVFLCWQPPSQNAWIAGAMAAIAPFMPADTPPPDPTAPGPFSLADPTRIQSILESAGYEQIDITPVAKPMVIGETVDEVMVFQSRIGPLSGLLESLDDTRAAEATQAVREVFENALTDEGVVMGAAAWLVTANNPAA